MEPEEYLWFRLAHEIGWPVSLVKQLTTVSEFDKWTVFFRMRREQHDKEDWYSAATIRAIFHAMTGKAGDLDSYLLKFEAPVEKEPTPVEAVQSESLWLALMGIDKDDPETWGKPE